jgi:hypothetical protein
MTSRMSVVRIGIMDLEVAATTCHLRLYWGCDPIADRFMNRHIDWTMGLRANVCARFRSAIADGLLTPRDRIPSARALAKGIGFG